MRARTRTPAPAVSRSRFLLVWPYVIKRYFPQRWAIVVTRACQAQTMRCRGRGKRPPRPPRPPRFASSNERNKNHSCLSYRMIENDVESPAELKTIILYKEDCISSHQCFLDSRRSIWTLYRNICGMQRASCLLVSSTRVTFYSLVGGGRFLPSI